MTEKEFNIGFAMNFSKYLRKYSISIDQLSRYTGINRTTLFRYKSGKRVPTVMNLYKIAEVLGISPWTLCDFSEFDISDKYDYGDNIYNDIMQDKGKEETTYELYA